MKKRLVLLIMVAIIATCALACFASCDKAEDVINEIRVEEAENIAYDNGYITWDKTNADYYTVSINGGEAQRSNSTTFAYDSQGERFEVTIVSVLGNSTASASKTFIPLEKVSKENVVVSEGGAVSWQAVSGADAYLISVNGQTLVSPLTDTVYDKLSAGSNRVKIKPIVKDDDSYYSSWSDEINVYIYAAPTAIKYDGSTISWSGNASTYLVTVNGQSKEISGNSMAYSSGNADFEVTVKAVGNHTSTYDSAETTDSFFYLDPVTGITVVDGVLVWNEVENAQGYRISIDGVVRNESLDTNSYALVSGKSVDVKLMPFNNSGNYFSSWTNEQSFYILATPVVHWNASMELDGEKRNNFYWDATGTTGGFTVKLEKDGSEPLTVSVPTATSFEYDYLETGVYKVSVKANADESDASRYDSAYSKPIVVERLAGPSKNDGSFVTSDPSNIARGFTVNFKGVSNAKEYQLYKDGVKVEGKTTTGSSLNVTEVASASVIEEQHFNYSIRSIGQVKQSGGTTYVYLSCLSTNALDFEITVQAMPSGLTMEGYNAKWNVVAGANGYAVACGNAVDTANENTFNLSDIEAGLYEVKVCTRGDGATTLASGFTSPVNVQRLNAPYDIKITAGEGNGMLEFAAGDVISGFVAGYTAYIGTELTAIGEDKFGEMYDYILTKGTSLSMTADANEYNSDGTLYYMTSQRSATKQFIRLEAPVFADGCISSQSELKWEASANINTAVYTPTYVLSVSKDGAGATSRPATSSTSFPLSQLDAGVYTVTVKAIGNNTVYLDSESSESFTFTKLATPVMNVVNNEYSWTNSAQATSYSLVIDGKTVQENIMQAGETFSYKPRYTSLGDHTVKLYAVGNGVDTVTSDPFEYVQKTAQLSAPVVTSVVGVRNDETKGGTVTVTVEAVQNALGYQYEVKGTDEYSAETVYNKTLLEDGVCNVRVKAVGGAIDAGGVYYLDSAYSASTSVNFLAAVNANGFEINGDGRISWNTVSDAKGYDYCIQYDNGAWTEATHIDVYYVDVTDFSSYGLIRIRVRASADGSNGYVDSVWTEWMWKN